MNIYLYIREKITPRGDGNFSGILHLYTTWLLIREKITPRGDGNGNPSAQINVICNTRKDNSERRRKQFQLFFCLHFLNQIREKITPRGDGNQNLASLYIFYNQYTRKDNSERRRKQYNSFFCSNDILIYTRKDNSERRRKPAFSFCFCSYICSIREKITPRGDGNFFKFYGIILLFYIIREKITLRGDGNF